MSETTETRNPRYEHDTQVFHEKYGYGKTFNPRVGSQYVDVIFSGERHSRSVYESDLVWPMTDLDRRNVIGNWLLQNDSLLWLYTLNDQLNNKSPRNVMDEGNLDLVEEVFEKTFFS